jgi:hypothetical protein
LATPELQNPDLGVIILTFDLANFKPARAKCLASWQWKNIPPMRRSTRKALSTSWQGAASRPCGRWVLRTSGLA